MTVSPKAPAVIHLAENMDITQATPLVAELMKLRGNDIRIDASSVRRLGGQCLQALLCASTTWAHDGARMELVDPSPDFTENLTAYGLDARLFDSQESAI